MAARKLITHTQRSHIYSCKRFAAWLKRSPDTATADEVRRFQLHLIESGASICNRNRIMTGVRFLFRVTLRRHDLAAEVWHIKEPQKLPPVLSPEEVKRVLAMATSLKARAMLTLSYGCGPTTSYLRGGAPRFEGDKPHFLYRSTDRDGGVHSRRASIQKPGGISQAHFPWASSLSETQPSRPRLSHGATDVYPRRANIPRLFACGQRPTQRLQKPECSMPVVGRFGDRTNCRRIHDSQHARVRCVSAARLSANPSFFRWQPT